MPVAVVARAGAFQDGVGEAALFPGRQIGPSAEKQQVHDDLSHEARGSVGNSNYSAERPKTCVQYIVPSSAFASPTPISSYSPFRMFALCPSEFIQVSIASCGVRCPSAMFSAAAVDL